jgi:Putative Ig domain/Bacterial Ig-like domain (group 3)
LISPDGQYPIAIAVGTLSATNYDFVTVGGALTVANSPIMVSPTTLPVATVGTAYSQQLTASAGSGSDYTFTATGLPSGLSLTLQGLLSGMPTAAIGVPYNVDVSVTDSGSNTGSQSYPLTVKAATNPGSVGSSPTASYYGQGVTLTATFSATKAGSAPMTGTVSFYDGSTLLGTEPLVPNGVSELNTLSLAAPATPPIISGTSRLTTSALPVGNDTVTAVYTGNANYSSASSKRPVSVQVAPAVTTVTLTAPTTAGGTTLIATIVVISPGNPLIVGNVSFYDGSTFLETEPVTNGIATLNVGTLSAGSHSFSAVFSGGRTFSDSRSTLVVSTDGPQVTSVTRYGFHAQWTYLLMNFTGPLDPTTAQNALNYQIVGPSGHRIKVASAIYDSATQTVTLVPSTRLNVHWRYSLTVNGTAPSGLTSPLGVLLDGAGTGQPGSNHVTSITWGNLAGTASELPTLRLIDPPDPRPGRTEKWSRQLQPKLHAEAVDHLLTTRSLHFR